MVQAQFIREEQICSHDGRLTRWASCTGDDRRLVAYSWVGSGHHSCQCLFVLNRWVVPESITCDQSKTCTPGDWCCVLYFATPGISETQRRQSWWQAHYRRVADRHGKQSTEVSLLYSVLEFELVILKLKRSVKTGDFKLYIHSLFQLLPWPFALDHANHACWLCPGERPDNA